MPPPASLAEYALAIVMADQPAEKVALAFEAEAAFRVQTIPALKASQPLAFPARPGRLERPVLLPPGEMPKRKASSRKGLIALVHSLTHIELSAIDMTWDLIGRFANAPLPPAFLDEAVKVGLDEARHFSLINEQLERLGARYGDLPAHAGLWEAADNTGHDLLARLAIVPLVLEARGLDVSPAMIKKVRQAGEHRSADVMQVIYDDEITHVAFGARWFRHICRQRGERPEPLFHQLVKRHFRGGLKPPFNETARSSAGLTPGFYRPLATPQG